MVTFDSTNSHFDYIDGVRHFCARSEKYTGGDALLTFLYDSWEIKAPIYYKEHRHAGVRMVIVYNITLERGGETLLMPVFHNPFVERMLRNMDMQILPVNAQAESMYQPQRGS